MGSGSPAGRRYGRSADCAVDLLHGGRVQCNTCWTVGGEGVRSRFYFFSLVPQPGREQQDKNKSKIRDEREGAANEYGRRKTRLGSVDKFGGLGAKKTYDWKGVDGDGRANQSAE